MPLQLGHFSMVTPLNTTSYISNPQLGQCFQCNCLSLSTSAACIWARSFSVKLRRLSISCRAKYSSSSCEGFLLKDIPKLLSLPIPIGFCLRHQEILQSFLGEMRGLS